jgi:hypothetical protein
MFGCDLQGRVGLQPGGGVQADLSRGGEVPLRRHGHRVPGRGRQVPTDQCCRSMIFWNGSGSERIHTCD